MKNCLILMLGFVTTCCSHQNKDGIIKADLATKAKYELDFAGVRFTVEKGIVTFNGNCATGKAREHVLETGRKLYGVKGVINELSIAPVIIGTDWLLKQAVDSILKKYPGIEAITQDSVIVIKGKIKMTERAVLVQHLNMLNPKHIQQELENAD